MQSPTTVRAGCKDTCALFASSGLVTASAGFGAVYAWQSSATHGLLLASLAVLMALSLEIAKPLAVTRMLDAARRIEIGRAAALFLLAAIAVAYSVTAELSLMARSRADAAAERAGESRKAEEARARVEVLRAEIARHDTTAGATAPVPPPAPPCSGEWLANARARAACLEQSGLHAKAMETHAALTAQHREATAAERHALVERLERAEEEAGRAPVVRQADPGARALSSYLSAVGVEVAPERLADWLVLVGVLALEMGSALAGLLVGPARAGRMAAEVRPRPLSEPRALIPLALPGPGSDTARERVLALVRQEGGAVQGGQRVLAERAGVSRARLRQVLDALAAEGRVSIRAEARGTAVRLLA